MALIMVKRENILPFSPLGDLMADNTGKRISADAKKTAAKILEDLTERIIHKANLLAENSGRKTIKAKDLTLAYKQLGGLF
jgi:histone H3/H4